MSLLLYNLIFSLFLDIDEQPASLEKKQSKPIVAEQADPSAMNADDENEAATKIQAVVRGKKARDEVKALKAEKQETDTEKGNEVKEDVEEDTKDDGDINVENLNQEEKEELAAAAVKIQASFRGMKARKQKTESKIEGIDVETEDKEDAKPAEGEKE